MTDQKETLDVQEEQLIEYKRHGGAILGPFTSNFFYNDPKHLLFSLSRYKFVSKILNKVDSVLEVGCGDCFGSVIVAANVEKYYGVDFDEAVIEDNKTRLQLKDNMNFEFLNILENPFHIKADAAFSLDVIEHIPFDQEKIYINNIVSSVNKGPVLLGTPNEYAKAYASEGAMRSHINLKTPETLAESLRPHYKTVINFSMNDEVVHTGFDQMAHYIFALGVDPR